LHHVSRGCRQEPPSPTRCRWPYHGFQQHQGATIDVQNLRLYLLCCTARRTRPVTGTVRLRPAAGSIQVTSNFLGLLLIANGNVPSPLFASAVVTCLSGLHAVCGTVVNWEKGVAVPCVSLQFSYFYKSSSLSDFKTRKSIVIK
jgi:hypothetical protein